MGSRWLIRGAVGLLCLHATAVAAGAQLVDTIPWPTFQHDNRHTGRSSLAGPSGNAVTVKWSHKAVSWPKTQPAVTADTVYYAAGFQALCAVDAATGIKKWCGPKSGDANSSSPAIGVSSFGFDHTIYRGARDNKLWSINPDGTANFAYKIFLDGDIMGSVTIGDNGTIYMACGCLQAGIVHAMNPDGTLKWQLPIGQAINNSAPAIGSNGRIYIGAANGELFAIDDLGTAGQIAWSQKPSGATQNKNSSPAIREVPLTGGGVRILIYLGSDVGLSAFRDNGGSAVVLWTRATAGKVDTTAAIGPSGLVVSSFQSPPAMRTVYFLKFDGTDAAPPVSGPSTATTKHAQSPSAVIDVNGNIYQAIGKWVHAFAPDHTILWSHLLPAHAIAVALGDGVVYVGAKDSRLYALE